MRNSPPVKPSAGGDRSFVAQYETGNACQLANKAYHNSRTCGQVISARLFRPIARPASRKALSPEQRIRGTHGIKACNPVGIPRRNAVRRSMRAGNKGRIWKFGSFE